MPSPQTKGSKIAPEAFVLSGIGGCIDAIGLLTLGGLFVSHMSGNTAALGAAFGQGQWQLGWPHLFAVPIFVLGLFLGYVVMAEPTLRRCACVLLVEAFLLAIFGAALFCVGDPARNSPVYFLIATPPLLAMGLQNSTLRELGRSVFASTYITGVLDILGKSAAQAWTLSRYRKSGREIPGHLKNADPGMARSALLVWSSYVGGALISSCGLLLFPRGMVFLPVAILVGLALRFWSAPESTDQPQSGHAP
jgi:uncharacterized membrane protein YoaK (UPF0700 family)